MKIHAGLCSVRSQVNGSDFDVVKIFVIEHRPRHFTDLVKSWDRTGENL